MKAVIIGSDQQATNFATLAIRLRWPDSMPVIASNGAEGVASVAKHLPDLVLLHPDFSDMELTQAIQEVRERSMAPLLVLGCQGSQMELVTSLTAGADDYVKLPCNITELTVRIWATLRRITTSTVPQNEAPLRSGPLLLNVATREAFLGDKPLHFTPTEFRLLQKLIENNGAVVTHRMLESCMAESDADCQGLVKKYIQRLRSKLGDNAKDPVWIACIHGIGYRFIGPAPASKEEPAHLEPEPKRLVGALA